jgi:SAM-dependent methyltransferase
MHSNSLHVFRRFGLPHFQPGMKVLELGPDPQHLCRSLVLPLGVSYHFADVTNARSGEPGFQAMQGEYAVACAEGVYDLVFSANVIEHVPKVWRWLTELARIIRPGGLVICVNPVSWPYHEAPRDCWRLFPDAYRALFDEAGLEPVFTWHGNLVPIDPFWRTEHGPHTVTDTIAVGRKPAAPT